MNDNLPTGPTTQTGVSVGMSKEVDVSSGAAEVPLSKEAGREADALPKEVSSTGVTIHPTTIPIPPPVAELGVKPAGANIPMPTASETLPITDQQIAQGLGESIRESVRWLAEWCRKRLKQANVGLRSIGGRLTRVPLKNS